MTNPVTRRAIRVGEVPSSNLGAPIKKPRKCGVFCWRHALVGFGSEAVHLAVALMPVGETSCFAGLFRATSLKVRGEVPGSGTRCAEALSRAVSISQIQSSVSAADPRLGCHD
jgi:hypothetical protein